MRRLVIGLLVVAAVAVVGLGVRSYWWSDEVQVEVTDLFAVRFVGFRGTGVALVGPWMAPGAREVRARGGGVEWRAGDVRRFVPLNTVAGFCVNRGRWWGIGVPLWAVGVGLGVAAGWIAVPRRRRRGAHECAVCGYDLRATPGRCPECGAGAKAAGGVGP